MARPKKKPSEPEEAKEPIEETKEPEEAKEPVEETKEPEEVKSSYMGYPATVAPGEITVIPDDQTPRGDQHWWVPRGFGGTKQPVLVIKYTAPHLRGEQTVYAWDGDGSATARFIDGESVGHMEILGN